MDLVRFSPWAFTDIVQRDFDRGGLETPVADWSPAVDVIEEAERFVLCADVPGVPPENIDISMEDGILSIAGERQIEKHGDAEGVKRFERVSGRFHRRFTLPDTADADNITARSTNGTLEITIPKLPAVRPRRITVEAA
jgi:HSP20 family protein